MKLRLPASRATTAQLASIYPFIAQKATSAAGIHLGADLLSGGRFAFDPFVAYQNGLVTNPNMLVAGEPGAGKSAVMKSFLHRSIAVGNRWAAVCDPKGEYTLVAEELGMPVIALRPGGTERLNPLDADRSESIASRIDRHAALCAALAATVVGRQLSPFEDGALTAITTALATRRSATLSDVVALLIDPTDAIAERCRCTAGEFTNRVDALTWALTKLLDRSLRSMFDGPTTTRPDPDGPGVVIDLSGVHHDPGALAVVLVAATTWLQSALVVGERRRFLILDEAWSLLASEPTVRFLQACWKLSRAYGVANVAIIHRLTDLRAQADDGTATAKIAAGLLADTNTRVLFRQSPDQTDDARKLLGLTSTESTVLTRLARGRALWKIADRTAVVHHYLSPRERVLCDSDTRMAP